jgi:hypothetical protein
MLGRSLAMLWIWNSHEFWSQMVKILVPNAISWWPSGA